MGLKKTRRDSKFVEVLGEEGGVFSMHGGSLIKGTSAKKSG